MEKKSVVRYPASWDLGVDVRLWETEVEVTDHFLSDDSHIQVYTDGSGYQNGVGASAVLFRNRKEMEAIRYRLGMDTEHEVYEGECIGLILALHLLTAEPDTRSVSIWVENTAALQVITNPKPGPAHYILDWFHHALETYKRQNPDVPVFLSWIPSHTGILDNERADEEAKRAAAGDSSPSYTNHSQSARRPSSKPSARSYSHIMMKHGPSCIVTSSLRPSTQWRQQKQPETTRSLSKVYTESTPAC
ncbi:hypothetical protein D9758_010847 [Tetrapyrgos nigripes]|uniref:RNase H type-1 domain-containing protein n=1 Tax=Tetrapyrgos nigripes TaxID=182062 RepID=A0A8H5GIQ3_9AGAR|nr:hypothetical protein D9758_010847 [Tetrapyrgos nigripes]